MKVELIIIVFLSFAGGSLSQSAFNGCNILFPKESCFAAYTALKTSLVDKYKNIYELQRAFYPIGKFASGRLVNVLYIIEYTSEELSDKEQCAGVDQETAMAVANGNLTLKFLTGWSSSGVFNILSPLQLTKLQLQLSNVVFGFFIIPGSGIYKQFRFGLPADDVNNIAVDIGKSNIVNLTISIDNITCIPDKALIKSSLLDISAMLKVWASTEGLIPEAIDESILGYVTEPGIENDKDIAVLVEFEQFFAILFSVTCLLLGLSTIPALGLMFPKLDELLGRDRQQYHLYFFGTAGSCFIVCMFFIVLDMIMIPQWCETEYISFISGSTTTGCDGTVITKIVYYCIAVPGSFCSAIFATRASEKQLAITRNYHDLKLVVKRRSIYILSTWFVIMAVSFGAWALIPTVLQMLVYPPVILTLTLVMWATIFWFSVIFTIPLLLYRNIKMKSPCLVNFYYLSPFLAMVIVVFVFGFVTIIYLDAIAFGTQIGDVVGIVIAAVPSIALTLFTEFYRDWFLTKTAQNPDEIQIDEQDVNIEENGTKTDIELHTIPKDGAGTSVGYEKQNSIEHQQRRTSKDRNLQQTGTNMSLSSIISPTRRPTGLISTGEPPGLLKLKLKNLSHFTSQ